MTSLRIGDPDPSVLSLTQILKVAYFFNLYRSQVRNLTPWGMIDLLVIPAKPNRRICSITDFRDDGVAVLEYFADFHRIIMSFVIEWQRLLFDWLAVPTICHIVNTSPDWLGNSSTTRSGP